MDFTSTPEWLGAGLLTAAFAAAGYVLKQIVEGFVTWDRENKRMREERRTRLIALRSVLQAGKAVFLTQIELRNALYADICLSNPVPLPHSGSQAAAAIREQAGLREGEGPDDEGFEARFAEQYPYFTPEQLELHQLIRGYTMHALRPVNQETLMWLREDTYYKSPINSGGATGKLAEQLAQLEAHLILWNAKYEIWIPEQPSHALVYLADERHHGIGFPLGIERTIDDILQANE